MARTETKIAEPPVLVAELAARCGGNSDVDTFAAALPEGSVSTDWAGRLITTSETARLRVQGYEDQHRQLAEARAEKEQRQAEAAERRHEVFQRLLKVAGDAARRLEYDRVVKMEGNMDEPSRIIMANNPMTRSAAKTAAVRLLKEFDAAPDKFDLEKAKPRAEDLARRELRELHSARIGY